MLIFLCPQTVTHQWFILFIACSISTMRRILSKGDFVHFSCMLFLYVQSRGNWKSAEKFFLALMRSFFEKKCLMELCGITTQMQNEQITGRQNSAVFSNASRCCFESSNGRGRELSSVKSLYHTICYRAVVLLLFFCVFVIIIAKSCLIATW